MSTECAPQFEARSEVAVVGCKLLAQRRLVAITIRSHAQRRCETVDGSLVFRARDDALQGVLRRFDILQFSTGMIASLPP